MSDGITVIVQREMNADEIAEREKADAERPAKLRAEISEARRLEYARVSDPIFMKFQRGEATKQEWLDAVQAINTANPYPVK